MKRRMMRQLLWIFALTRGYRWKMVGYISLDILTLLLGLAFVYESKHAVDIVTGSAAGSLRLIILLIVSSVALGILTGQWSAWISERMKVRMTVALQDTLVDSQMRAVWESTKAMAYGRFTVPLEHGCGGSRPDDCHHFSVSFRDGNPYDSFLASSLDDGFRVGLDDSGHFAVVPFFQDLLPADAQVEQGDEGNGK